MGRDNGMKLCVVKQQDISVSESKMEEAWEITAIDQLALLLKDSESIASTLDALWLQGNVLFHEQTQRVLALDGLALKELKVTNLSDLIQLGDYAQQIEKIFSFFVGEINRYSTTLTSIELDLSILNFDRVNKCNAIKQHNIKRVLKNVLDAIGSCENLQKCILRFPHCFQFMLLFAELVPKTLQPELLLSLEGGGIEQSTKNMIEGLKSNPEKSKTQEKYLSSLMCWYDLVLNNPQVNIQLKPEKQKYWPFFAELQHLLNYAFVAFGKYISEEQCENPLTALLGGVLDASLEFRKTYYNSKYAADPNVSQQETLIDESLEAPESAEVFYDAGKSLPRLQAGADILRETSGPADFVDYVIFELHKLFLEEYIVRISEESGVLDTPADLSDKLAELQLKHLPVIRASFFEEEKREKKEAVDSSWLSEGFLSGIIQYLDDLYKKSAPVFIQFFNDHKKLLRVFFIKNLGSLDIEEVLTLACQYEMLPHQKEYYLKFLKSSLKNKKQTVSMKDEKAYMGVFGSSPTLEKLLSEIEENTQSVESALFSIEDHDYINSCLRRDILCQLIEKHKFQLLPRHIQEQFPAYRMNEKQEMTLIKCVRVISFLLQDRDPSQHFCLRRLLSLIKRMMPYSPFDANEKIKKIQTLVPYEYVVKEDDFVLSPSEFAVAKEKAQGLIADEHKDKKRTKILIDKALQQARGEIDEEQGNDEDAETNSSPGKDLMKPSLPLRLATLAQLGSQATKVVSSFPQGPSGNPSAFFSGTITGAAMSEDEASLHTQSMSLNAEANNPLRLRRRDVPRLPPKRPHGDGSSDSSSNRHKRKA